MTYGWSADCKSVILRLARFDSYSLCKNMKTYVIRKYVKAKSALDAIKKEKKKEVDDVYVYEHNDNEMGFRSTSVVGVEVNTESSEYELEEKNTL